MSKDGSVAPKERINIRYVPATLGQQAEVELPLRVMVLGNFLGKPDSTPLEERQTLRIDKNNFNAVMEEAEIGRDLTVTNALTDEEESELHVSLSFKSLSDFEPDSIVKQVPELRKLTELREALVALKGPLGNMPAFRSRLQGILDDDESRAALLAEIQSIEHATVPESSTGSGKGKNEAPSRAVDASKKTAEMPSEEPSENKD